MKTQPLSTLTHNKVWIIFFLNLLYLKWVEAGQAFKNCLKYEMFDDTSYENLLKYNFPLSIGISNVCCEQSRCYQWDGKQCGVNGFYFACTESTNPGSKEYIFCGTWSLNQTQLRLLKRCGGIVGESLITTKIVKGEGFCTDRNISLDIISKMDKYLSITTTLVGLEQGYASWNCLNDACRDFDACVWDNSGWTCFNSGCHLQWPAPWPGLVANNPYPTSTTSTSTNTQTTQLPTSTVTPVPAPDHLVEKILIPVGTIAGVGLASGLTYYFYQKKKRQRQLVSNNWDQLATNNLNSEIINLNERNIDSSHCRNPHTETDEHFSIIEQSRNPQGF